MLSAPLHSHVHAKGHRRRHLWCARVDRRCSQPGATGFTGKLCVEHILKTPDVKIALAGRSRSKLEAVQAQYDQAKRGEIIIAEGSDADSLRRMCARSKVVLNMVGPYASRAAPVIEACIAEGAHYLDLTAETIFVRDMIARYEDSARKAGVLIIHSVGCDSIPYDLTTFEGPSSASEPP